MDSSGERTSRAPRASTDESDLEDQSRISGSARGSNFLGYHSLHELREDAIANANPRNSTSDTYSDVEINGAVNVPGFTQQIEPFQKREAKGSVDSGYHGSKADDVSNILTPSSFEKQNESGNALAARSAGENNKSCPIKGTAPNLKLFKYADHVDILLITLGTIMAILDGFVWSMMASIQSKFLNKFASLAFQNPINVYDEICGDSPYSFPLLLFLPQSFQQGTCKMQNVIIIV